MKRCGRPPKAARPAEDPCRTPAAPDSGFRAPDGPLAYFGGVIDRCLDAAQAAKKAGRPVVGILCEYTPRELILAAGGLPVCLCGGDADTIPVAEGELPANLCPLVKSTYGYHVTNSNPFLDLMDLIVAETTCDGKKKMYELMARTRPMFILELPQKEDDADAFVHWRRELEKLKRELERRFGVRLAKRRLREAIGVMNRERALRRTLAGFMKADAPPLSGRELIELKSSISGIPEDLEQYEKAIEILKNSPPLPGAAKRVRVLLTGVPLPHGAERVLDLLERHGGLVVCQENCTGLKPIVEDVDADAPDPLEAIARKYLHLPCSVMTPNNRRLESLRRFAAEFRPQCVVELIWQACLTYDVEAARVKHFVETELGLPYLRIETDYSPSDSARIAVRIEALFETVRSKGGPA